MKTDTKTADMETPIEQTATASKPLVSVVVEGYNESRELGTAAATMDALKQQDFPLERVEVVLVGSLAQTEEWKRLYSSGTPFLSVRTVEIDGANYYELKNLGAEIACGEIIAFTDSDVRPKSTWLSSAVGAIESGADVVVGPSLFRNDSGFNPDDTIMQIAASITWGWILGKNKGGQLPQPLGFMDHNVVFRAETFRTHQYRTEFGRICASPLLYRAIVNAGGKIALQPKQQVAHYFSWRYWLVSLHFRYGYEVFSLRRLDKDYPNQWIARTSVLEPLVTMGWHVMLDIRRWFRFSRLLEISSLRRWALLPLVAVMSAVARASEMSGMYATLLAPLAMKQWAEKV
ncbi:glycosyltransferase [Kamptonema formosum]|uniref:glycosyltransferase n=1 Tax=Kamptonema formosum TaxID=331992 RepID=UPI00034D1034|nr:glycosyltransferase [Oscillatoria sp. PCC 10802]